MRRGIIRLGLLVLLAAPSGGATAATYDVGPGQPVASPTQVPPLAPGDRVVLHGALSGPITVPSRGTREQPIVISGAPGSTIDGSVVLEGARHVVLERLTIRHSHYPGIVLRAGAADDTVRDNTVSETGLGIWIGSGAGDGHHILGNTVHDNSGDGIAIDRINAALGRETVIAGNHVFHNGIHGIEINGNRYIVEHNIVHDNGFATYGASGIHVFAKDAREDTGKHNVIRYNVSYHNTDRQMQDGNGIELDQWCDDNEITFNLAFGNDGAGIVLFDAADNLVANNTLFGNMRDPGHTHVFNGDLVVASDATKHVDHAAGNTLRRNLVVATDSRHYAIYVDGYASRHTKEIAGNNLVQQAEGGRLYFWKGETGRDVARWNALKPGAPDFSAPPDFANPATPYDPATGRSGLVPRRAFVPSAAVALASTRAAGIPAPVSGPPPGATARPEGGIDLAGTRFETLPVGAFAPSPPARAP